MIKKTGIFHLQLKEPFSKIIKYYKNFKIKTNLNIFLNNKKKSKYKNVTSTSSMNLEN